jgi:anti-sigma-K factor RskA
MNPDLHALSGAYALDALDEHERRQFEQHLAGCANCRAEVAELTAAASRLGAAAAMTPPPGLRDSVLAEIRQTRQLPPQTAGTGGRQSPWRTRLLLAAASVLAVLAGTLGVLAWQADERAADLRAQSDRIAAVITAPDALTVSGPVEGGGQAAAVTSSVRGEIALLADGLAALPSERTYQLWVISPDEVRSGGVVDISDGRARYLTAADMSGVTTVALSVEPAGGSAEPTTDPVWLLDLEP